VGGLINLPLSSEVHRRKICRHFIRITQRKIARGGGGGRGGGIIWTAESQRSESPPPPHQRNVVRRHALQNWTVRWRDVDLERERAQRILGVMTMLTRSLQRTLLSVIADILIFVALHKLMAALRNCSFVSINRAPWRMYFNPPYTTQEAPPPPTSHQEPAEKGTRPRARISPPNYQSTVKHTTK
jgi:hypothetical protein